MTKKPNSRRNLDLAIERLADDKGEALRLRRIFANTVVAQMMPAGAVKGGSAMRIRFGYSATRFSTDLDAATTRERTTSRASRSPAASGRSRARMSFPGTV